MSQQKIFTCSYLLLLLVALPLFTLTASSPSMSPIHHHVSIQTTVNTLDDAASDAQQKRPNSVPNQIVVKFKSDVKHAAINTLNEHVGAKVLESHSFSLKTLEIPPHLTMFETLQRYKHSPLVHFAEPNNVFHTLMAPNDPYYSYQWHMQSQEDGGINMEPAWNLTTGKGTVVAVVDTGVSIGTDLESTTFANGYDFVNDDSEPNDNHGHGTHVTGTIAQSTNNEVGVAGIAYNATVMPIKALSSEGKGELGDIVDGIRYAVDNGADIINMSFGTNETAKALKDAVQYAYNNNVTCVAAAGNSNKEPIAYPAAYDEFVIAVGATQYDKTIAPYSNYGSSIDVVAPGGNVDVDQNNDGNPDGIAQQSFTRPNGEKEWGYYLSEGTSSACPHVAGVAALLHSIGASSPDVIRDILQSTATDLGEAGKDKYYGYGLINAAEALTTNDTFPPTLQIISPKQGERIKTENVSISWKGQDALSSIAYYEIQLDEQPWMSVDTATTYEFTRLTDGNHTLSVKAVDNANNSIVKVREFTVAAPPVLSILAPKQGAKIKASKVKVRWRGRDNGKIDHYDVRLNQRAWTSLNDTSYTFQNLDAGYYTVWIKAYDNLGYTTNRSVRFTINYTLIGGPTWKEELLVGIGSVVMVALGIYFIRKKKKTTTLKVKQ